MAGTVHKVYHGRNGSEGALVGALLRRPYLAVRAHIVEQLHAAGYTDLQAAHLAVFQHPGPQGRSPSEIARGASSTKQATNNVLTQLERAGYLVRVPNAENRRERAIELTPRGEAAIRTIRACITDLEDQWRAALGARRYDQMRSALQRLNDELD
jgi:DNA-binding MarR family transcriptional regulator